MCKELQLRADFLPTDARIDTIYLGGGTPSLLDQQELQALLDAIGTQYVIAPDAEITLEANPDDLTAPYLKMLAQSGINRLSIGVQSFLEKDLRALNRSHSAEQAHTCIQAARAVGIPNFSVDLIFGLAGQDTQAWENNIDILLALEVPHLSCYALTVEDKTALSHQVRTGAVRLPEDEIYEQQFLQGHSRLTAAGYDHYELSNYCLPGFASRHNSSYWDQVPYLGIGPAAHSFDGQSRSWNVNNNARYIAAIAAGESALSETELLSATDRHNEYLMTGLRRKAGIHPDHLQSLTHLDWEAENKEVLERLLEQQLMEKVAERYRLTPRGWLVSDAIIRDLFISSPEDIAQEP